MEAMARGVTDETIKIGLALIDVDAVREQFDVNLGSWPEGVVSAIEHAINADGGINGRHLEVVERLFVPLGTEDSERVCRELVEDEEVFAVVGTFVGDAALCVTETYATPYFGAFGLTPERMERSRAPFLTTAANEADSTSASVRLLLDEGVLDGAEVAIYHEVGTTPAFLEENVVSLLEAGGVNVVSVAQLSDHADDALAAGDEADRILQRFEADGADTVVNASGLPIFVPALERTNWTPRLVFLNSQIVPRDALEGFGLNDPAELRGAIGAAPGVLAEELTDDPVFLECIERINQHSDLNVTPQDVLSVDQAPGSRDFRTLPLVCDVAALLEAVLEAAGPRPSVDSILDGLADLDSFAIIGNPHASLAPDRWGVGTPPRLWEFDVTNAWFEPVDS